MKIFIRYIRITKILNVFNFGCICYFRRIIMEASDFRNGVTFVCDGQPCQVIEFQHVKPGKVQSERQVSTLQQSSILRISSVRIWITLTEMVTCITSWIRRHSR